MHIKLLNLFFRDKIMIKLYFFFSILLFLTSCAHRHNFVYLQGNKQDFIQNTSYTPKLKKDDFLSILVFSNDENTSKLFNISSSQANANRGYSMGSPALSGYLIDEKGEIDFPLIGKIKLEGISRNEACDLIKEKLKVYISNPIVQIQIQNFKITVLGEVNNPGTFTIPNERITIFEALGIAGDLTINGKRKNILVVRDENGVKKEFRVDLTSNKTLESPVYFLNQNDFIYIEPNQAKINSSATSTSFGILISISSLILTTINLVSK